MMKTIEHIGMIMDGNRRWAKSKGFNSYKGHEKGADVFVDVCDWCMQSNIEYLTVYAFSTENNKRPQIEISHILGLVEKFFASKIDLCLQKGVRTRAIGDRTQFDKKTLAIIENAEALTVHCTNLKVQIALNYGGRNEITRAVKKLANDLISSKLKVDDITENILSTYLDTSGIPDVDLVVRTGGAENKRLSNFLPWQTVYSELYFSDILWPDFSQEEFRNALDYYASIVRNQGK